MRARANTNKIVPTVPPAIAETFDLCEEGARVEDGLKDVGVGGGLEDAIMLLGKSGLSREITDLRVIVENEPVG
jgi:selenophosphate synthetase-related protein